MGIVFKAIFFFGLGAGITGVVLISTAYLTFSFSFKDKIYPGVMIGGRDVGGFSKKEVATIFDQEVWRGIKIEMTSGLVTASASGEELNLKPDTELMARRAYSIGRQTKNPYYNFLQILASYQGKITLPTDIWVDRKALGRKIDTVASLVEKTPVDAMFKFDPSLGPDGRGRVLAFKQSTKGLAIDREKLEQEIIEKARGEVVSGRDLSHDVIVWSFDLPLLTIEPRVSSSTADEMGIRGLLGKGESYFYDSIPGRVHNIELGSSKINGRLVAPGEIFSFDEAIGTVSAVFGYKKAYSIIQGKTVLDDGGGVCQVSTTLYRAVLNAGLPVVERVAHSYRVGFYEQGGFSPGLDATVYPPSPDFRFKNDTGNWILIQTNFDLEKMKLTFELFGTSDGRKVVISGPYILSTTPPPEPIYEDDPTLPVGQTKQVDTAHYGANVYFQRVVSRDDVTLIKETVYSDYVPWPARFLRGTKT